MSEAVVTQKEPYEIDVEAGKSYFWCTCGRTAKEAFCDGAHKDTSFKAMKFTAEAAEKVFLCGCRKTLTPPFCDGSHGTL